MFKKLMPKGHAADSRTLSRRVRPIMLHESRFACAFVLFFRFSLTVDLATIVNKLSSLAASRGQ